MKILVICNDPPYGTERSWNGLRLAGSLAQREGVEVKVFPARRRRGMCGGRPEAARRLLPPRSHARGRSASPG